MSRVLNTFLADSELVDLGKLKMCLKSQRVELFEYLNADERSRLERINVIYKFVLAIPYRYSHAHLPASTVFLNQTGNCTNKAVLAVALLRLAGISAGFYVSKYKKTPHLDKIGKGKTFSKIGSITTHVHSVVWFHDRWTHLDCTEDPDHAWAIHHYLPPVDWSGQDIWVIDLNLLTSTLGVWPHIEELTREQARNWSDLDIEIANRNLDRQMILRSRR